MRLIADALSYNSVVHHTGELQRIYDLPRRDWISAIGTEATPTEDIRDKLHKVLRLEGSEGESLRLAQVAALAESMLFNGTSAQMNVGTGKTLVSLLLPRLLRAVRPMLVIPASLRDKTRFERDQYAKNWWVSEIGSEDLVMREQIRLVSYSAISRLTPGEALDSSVFMRERPDVLIFDEASHVGDASSARYRRIRDYIRMMRKEENDRRLEHGALLKVFFLSATMYAMPIEAIAPLFHWSIGPVKSPLPIGRDLHLWSKALNVQRKTRRSSVSVGALRAFCTHSQPTLAQVREGVFERIRATPGVVAHVNANIDIPLNINFMTHSPAPSVQKALSDLDKINIDPDGMLIPDALTRWMVTRQLGCGFYSTWDPAPPPQWLEARRNWMRFLYDTIQTDRGDTRYLYSEKQVVDAICSGSLRSPQYDSWIKVMPMYPGRRKTVWLDYGYAKVAADWLAQRKSGILWAPFQALGRKISELSGVPYFKEADSETPVASGHDDRVILGESFIEGQNLQRWNDQLITAPRPSASSWEQLIGRTHRSGQKRKVNVTVLLGSKGHLQAWKEALYESRQHAYAKPKILFADVDESGADNF